MNKKDQKEFLNALTTILEQKGIKKDELENYLRDVFVKTFAKDFTIIPYEYRETSQDIEPANVEVNIDFDSFIFSVKRIWTINNGEILLEDIMRQIPSNSKIIPTILNEAGEEVKEVNLVDGETYIEEIDLANISNSKRQQLHQLLIQVSKETEKEKIFNKYRDLIDTVVNARVYKVEDTYAILKLGDETIFMPRKEMLPSDNFKPLDYVKVLIVDVNKNSKDSQIVGSRTRASFIKSLIENEIEEVKKDIVQIQRISREAGVKTKIAVSSTNSSIDPVGTIIGVKGSKIREIVKEINNEIIDVVEYSDDDRILISNLFHPAKVRAINLDEENRKAFILVNDNDFLQAIGKRGINVKLVAQITGYKIDVVTQSDRNRFNLDFEPIQVKKSNNQNNRFNNQKNFKLEIKSLEELIADGNKLEEDEFDSEI